MIVRTRLFNLVLIGVMAFGALGIMAQPVQAAPADLFISEYIEGGSYNKAIEIYNGTGATVDLSQYSLDLYSNAATSPSYTMDLSGMLADGEVFVVAHGSAAPEILAQADLTNSLVINFNGDDSIILRKGAATIDAFGQIGAYTVWGTSTDNTKDHTLVRKASVCFGDINGTDAFDPTIEWDFYAKDTFSYLGSHTADCGGGVVIAEPVINEFSASTTGDDVEYVEIFGDPDTDYSAYTVLEIEGDSSGSGLIDGVFALGATDANGLFLVSLSNGDLENGSLTLLLVKDFSGAFGEDIDADNDGIIDYAPWEAVVDAVAVNDGDSSDHNYGVPVLYGNYDGLSSYPPGGASRIPDGYDTDAASDWLRNDFDLAGIPEHDGSITLGEAYNTPGEPNLAYTPPPEACGDPYTPIYEIQGDGMTTPIPYAEVATEGIVVGDYQDGGKDGFFIQDAYGDGNPATSDGIFVYAPGGLDVNLGDYVRVRGQAKEYYDLTEVGSVSQIWQCSAGNAIPTVIGPQLPVSDWSEFEPYEGMSVVFAQDLVISEYYNFDRYGTVVLTSSRHMTPTALYEPGSPEIDMAMDDFALDSITLDDGRTNQNPDPAYNPAGGVFGLDNLFRGGSLLRNLNAVVDYSYGAYVLQPAVGAEYIDSNPRTASPDVAAGDLRIASLNVYNYFTTIDDGNWICGPSGDMECRGADNADELARQRAKIIAALNGIDGDVVGLMEIENDRPGPAPDYAVADLVAGLNDLVGADTYAYVPTGAIGTDAIKTALIYKPAKVSQLGSFAVLDSSYDPLFLDDYNRPVLAVTFVDNFSGQGFTVAVNHLKSKGSDCNDLGDYDLGDGAGNCNITRTNAAIAEINWLANDPTGTGVKSTIIIGDLNSYDKEDPIDMIKLGPDGIAGTSDDYFDMLYEFQGEYAYSYVFDGQTGYLDYALANAYFAQFINDVNTWHINADEPDLIDYDTSYKKPAQDAIYAPDAYRSSDHDPVIISVTFEYDVMIDVKPGSCDDPFNVKGKGVLPVAILGSDLFDVTMVDPTTVTLAGVPADQWAFEDVSTIGDCSAYGGDGHLDLVLHFDVEAVTEALGEVSDGDSIDLMLEGYILPDLGNVHFSGFDTVTILKKGK